MKRKNKTKPPQKKKQPKAPKKIPEWGVHLGDGTAIIKVDAEANVVLSLLEAPDAPPILLQPIPAAQLGLTLAEAARHAGVLKNQLEEKAAREAEKQKAKAARDAATA